MESHFEGQFNNLSTESVALDSVLYNVSSFITIFDFVKYNTMWIFSKKKANQIQF